MDEYIKRADAINARGRSCDRKCAECDFAIDGDSWCEGEVFVVDLLRIPAADVRPVVLCRDCKHSYDSVGGWCCSHGICVDCIVREDFFCAEGEKREEN